LGGIRSPVHTRTAAAVGGSVFAVQSSAMQHYYAVIMAGGGGTRLWPLSRQAQPKQSIPLLGDETLFQIAVHRLQPLFLPERILVVTSAAYRDLLHRQAPEVPLANFIIEPAPRGTAPALGLAALALLQRDPDAVMACLTADHFIADEGRFRDVLIAAHDLGQQGHLVTLGIAPTYAATGFGYIQRGESLGTVWGFEAFRAERFKEKPGRAEAAAMVADGLHSWNSGMFVWRAERLMQEFAGQMTGFRQQLERIAGEPARLAEIWEGVGNATIDYGVMEGATQVAVIPAAELGWNDVGSWESLFEVLPADGAGNVVIGTELLEIATRNTLVHSSNPNRRLVAALGVHDLVVVDTGDILLICPRERSQEVKDFVTALKTRADGKAFL